MKCLRWTRLAQGYFRWKHHRKDHITYPEARPNCMLSSEFNREESISCAWNGMNIFTNEIDAGECAWVP